MAITAAKSPYIMTAVADDLSTVFQPRDPKAPTPGIVKYKCVAFRVVYSGAGNCTILDKLGGQVIFQSSSAAAGQDTLNFDGDVWFDGAYISALTAGTVYIYIQ